MSMQLTADEISGRGIETISDPVELDWLMQAVIRSVPEDVPKENVLGVFDDAWAHIRGD